MKKLLVALVVLAISMTACMKSKEEKAVEEEAKKYNEIVDNLSNSTNKNEIEKSQENKDKAKSEQNIEKTQNKADVKDVSAIYFKKSIVTADKNITSEKVNEYIAKDTKLEVNDNTPISIKIENGEIKSVETTETATVFGKYVGLIDSNNVEFEYDSNSFVVKVDEKQVSELEKVNQDTLLSLNLMQNKKDGSIKLVSFETK